MNVKQKTSAEADHMQSSLLLMPEWPLSEWMDWMGQWGATMPATFKETHWDTYVERWQKLNTPQSSIADVESFLKKYALPSPYDQRLQAGWSKEYVEVRNAVIEPLSVAFGLPENPHPPLWPMLKPGDPAPVQADYDERLGKWLRLVIRSKDILSLRHLITALEKVPCLRPGITEDEFLDGILGDETIQKAETPRLQRILFTFLNFIGEYKRLPAKAELRSLSGLEGEEHKTNFSGYLKTLGLGGLPQVRREAARFVTRKRKPLRTQTR